MRIGEYQELEVGRETQHGYYLRDDEDEVLLPRGQIPRGLRIGDKIRVFVLTDSEDRPVATTKHPIAGVGEFGIMKVVSVTRAGAFLDWGLDKDLFVPAREQRHPMRIGETYLVRVYLDEVSERVVGTSKWGKYLKQEGTGLEPGQKVRIMVAERIRDLITVIINNEIKGMLFPDEWHEKLNVGDVRDAYVKQIRPEDNKVAVSLRPQGYQAVLGERDSFLAALKSAGGTLPVSDKTSPEEIHRRFGLSKGSFKKLLGALLREGLIEIGPDSVRLKG